MKEFLTLIALRKFRSIQRYHLIFQIAISRVSKEIWF